MFSSISNYHKAVICVTLFALASCSMGLQEADKLSITKAYQDGDFTRCDSLIKASQTAKSISEKDNRWLEEQQARIDRIRIDFYKTEERINQELSQYFNNLSLLPRGDWERDGQLEMRIIDGQKRYFYNAVNNLFRLVPWAGLVRDSILGPRSNALDVFRKAHSDSVINKVIEGQIQKSYTYTIDFTITVDADAVPAGEPIKCWMPFPRISPPRQRSVELLSTNIEKYQISPPDWLHSSLYMEQTAVAGKKSIFNYRAKFTTCPEWHPLGDITFKPYDRTTDTYKKFTQEELPHVVFSDRVTKLADSITQGLNDPYEICKSLYYWVSNNIPWASALEYSIFNCIPDYCLKYKHGDCGMVTFLFMSMARYKGIPVKWQSGWMLHPGFKNLHDWSEVYFEDYGWVPVDMSFGLQDSERNSIEEFYISGIDAYRMIVNDGFAQAFYPAKKYYRSEPFDFQRGELEWSGGNIYFDKWSYSTKISYHNE